MNNGVERYNPRRYTLEMIFKNHDVACIRDTNLR